MGIDLKRGEDLLEKGDEAEWQRVVRAATETTGMSNLLKVFLLWYCGPLGLRIVSV